MTTGLQVVIAAGALLGLGAALLLIRLLPAEPDLADALGRLTPNMTRVTSTRTAGSGKERSGLWALPTLPPRLWVRTPTRELALLRIPLARFYGDKLTFAALGLVIPPLLGSFFDLLGLGLPYAIPAIGSLGLATVMFFLPNYNAVDDAKKARWSSPGRWAPTSTWSRWSATTAPAYARPWKPPPRSATRGSSPDCPRNSPDPAGQGCRPGTRCTRWPRNWACPSSTTSPPSCASPAKRAPVSTRPGGPAPPRCAPPC